MFQSEGNSTCFYCGSNNSFNKEHVFPCSLGGSDNRWVLKNCVCKNCNSFFSKLEVRFAKSSPEAYVRAINNLPGRTRRGKDKESRARELQNFKCYVAVLEDDLILEEKPNFKHIDQSNYRTSIIQKGDSIVLVCDVNCDNKFNEVEKLITHIQCFLQTNFFLVTKVSNSGDSLFEVAQLFIESGKTKVLSKFESSKPQGAWYKEFLDINLPIDFTSRVYLESHSKYGDRLEIQAKSLKDALFFIDLLLEKIPTEDSIKVAQNLGEFSIRYPSLTNKQASLKAEIISNARVVAKIGLNFLAKVHGDKFVRNTIFDEIKSFILHGKHIDLESSNFIPWQFRKDGFFDPLSKVIGVDFSSDKHWMILSRQDEGLIFVLKFYGCFSEYLILLCPDSPLLNSISNYLVSIDYINHTIESLSPPENSSVRIVQQTPKLGYGKSFFQWKLCCQAE